MRAITAAALPEITARPPDIAATERLTVMVVGPARAEEERTAGRVEGRGEEVNQLAEAARVAPRVKLLAVMVATCRHRRH